jgi:hypothetical protein
MKSAVQERDYFEEFTSTLRQALQEIAEMRREGPKIRADIERLRNSTRKRLERIDRQIENVKAAR